jgi:hypothetical protein
VAGVKWYQDLFLWAIAAAIACGSLAGLLWLGAIVASHLLGISVHDAFIGILKA